MNRHIPTPSVSPSPTKKEEPLQDLAHQTPPSSPRICVEILKSRKSEPHRSIRTLGSDDRTVQKIIKLDVYSLFLHNPKLLLQAVSSPIILAKPMPAVLSVTKPLPHLQDFATAHYNIEEYQNTQGAPPVAWKGVPQLTQ